MTAGEPRRALYIGRFQLFHLGHLDTVEHITAAADVDALIIVIGSAQFDHEHKSPMAPWAVNPFTCAERREMIQRSLEGRLDKPWSIHPVPDIFTHDAWLQLLCATVPPFQILYTAAPRERDLFGAEGIEVRGFPRIRDFHGGTLRARLARGQEVSSALPAGTLAVLHRIGAGTRLAGLFARDEAGAGGGDDPEEGHH